MQTRRHSMIEACTNTIVGYAINLCVQIVLYPMYGAVFTLGENIQIGLVFMAVSVARSYVLRRAFNRFRASLRPEVDDGERVSFFRRYGK